MSKLLKIISVIFAVLLVSSMVAVPGMAYTDDSVSDESPQGVLHLDIGETTEYEWTIDAEDVEYTDADNNELERDYSLLLYDSNTDVDAGERDEPIVSEPMSVEPVEGENEYVVSVSVADEVLLDNDVDSGDNIVVHLHEDTDGEHVSERDLLVGYILLDTFDSQSATLEILDVSFNDAFTSTVSLTDSVLMGDLDMTNIEQSFESDIDTDYDGDYAQALSSDLSADFEEAAEGFEDGDVIDSQATIDGEDFRVYLNEIPDDVDGSVIYDEELESIIVQDQGDSFDFKITPSQGYSTFGEFMLFDDFDLMDLFSMD